MFSTMRRSWLLFALLALIALSSALNLEDFSIDGVEAYIHHAKRQQPSGTGNSDPPPESTPTPPPEDDPTPSSPPDDEPSATPPPSRSPSAEPTPSDPPSQEPSQEPSQSPSNAPPPSSRPPPSSSRQQNPPSSNPTSASPQPSKPTVTTPIIRSTPLIATSVRQFTTVYTTVSNGQNLEVTSTGEATDLVTTGTAVSTELPLPQNGDGDSGSGGLSDSNKKIIGGVVGGVGGAILLGGIAIVCWRIWGRRNNMPDNDDDLVANTGAALGDKPHSSSTGNTPFQSNLEQYHNPGGRPNAAANF